MKNVPALIVATLIISGCSSMPGRGLTSIDAARPQIFVTSGNRVVVNQEPVIVPRTGADQTITWQLPSGGKAVFVRGRGITIDSLDKLLGPEGNPVKDSAAQVARINRELGADPTKETSIFRCMFVSDYEYSCVIPGAIKLIPHHGLFAYTIRVTVDGRLVISDPRLMI